MALWLMCPQLGPSIAAHGWPIAVWLDWEVVPQVLLTFTLLSVLREFGLRVQPSKCDAPRFAGEVRWRFTLRHLFAWVAGAAVRSFVWRRSFAVALGHFSPVGGTGPPAWRAIANGTISGLTLTAIELLAVWAVLRPGSLRWRLTLLAVVIAMARTTLWHCAVRTAFNLNIHWDGISADANQIRIYSWWCLVPVLLALALVRSGGYRWTASHSLSPQCPK